MSTRLEESGNRWGNFIQNRSITGLIVLTVVAFCALALFIGTLGLVFDWFSAGKQVISPANVRAQFALAYDDYNALAKLNDTLCIQQKAFVQETDPNAKTQRQSQLLAYEAQYNRVAAEYQARYDDAFRAKHIGPRDLPKTIPPVSDVLATCP